MSKKNKNELNEWKEEKWRKYVKNERRMRSRKNNEKTQTNKKEKEGILQWNWERKYFENEKKEEENISIEGKDILSMSSVKDKKKTNKRSEWENLVAE